MRQGVAILLLFSVLASVPESLSAQDIYWKNAYDIAGGNEYYPRIVYRAGYLYTLTAYKVPADDDQRVALSKIDTSGSLIWSKKYEEPGVDLIPNMHFSATDSVLMFSIFPSDTSATNGYRHYIITTDLNGDTLDFLEYQTQYRTRFYASKILDDHSILLTGYRQVDSNGHLYWVFQKIDSQGILQWYNEYPWPYYYNGGNSISLTSDGGYVLGGRSSGYDTTKLIQGMLIKTDSTGKIEWVKDFGKKWFDSATFTATSDSFIYVGGLMLLEGKDQYPWEGKSRMYVHKYTLSGDTVWQRFIGPYKSTRGMLTELHVLENKDVLAVGEQNDISGWTMGWMYRLTAEGDSVWQRFYKALAGLKHHHSFTSAVELEDNSIVAGGHVVPLITSQDTFPPNFWLLRVDSLGCNFPGCDTVCVKPSVRYEIEVLPNLNVRVTNKTEGVDISAIWMDEPGIGYQEFIDTIAEFQMSKPGILEISFVLEGPCNLSTYWDTTIYVDYVGTPVVEGEELNLQLYPNPATQILNLQWQGGTPAGTVSLYDLQGREVLQQAVLEASTQMDVSRLATALYLAIIRDEKGRVIWRKKVVVE